MKVIGLTGGIGSGKSTVSSLFKKLGARTIDADALVHQLYVQNTDLKKALYSRWGSEVFTTSDAIDRHKLGQIIFENPTHRQWLEGLIHPLVRQEIQNQIQALKTQKTPLILIDAALLIETGFYQDFEGLILVECTEAQQKERVFKRDSISVSEIERRMSAQMPLSEKKKFASWMIDNRHSLAETEKQVQTLYTQLTSSF